MSNLSKTITKNGITKSISQREIENGYIITISKYGSIEGGEYFDKTMEFYSKESLADKLNLDESFTNEEDKLKDSLSDIKSFFRSDAMASGYILGN